MKTNFTFIIRTSLLLAATILGMHAAEIPSVAKTSPEFEKMKTLAGTWKGKTDMGKGPVDLTIQYRVIAAGSVVEERSLPGTPNEMVTMYYVNKDGKLALTHYCMLGNRPAMTLASAKGNTFNFALDEGCECAKESHMNAVSLRFDDADTITSNCKAIIEGKEAPEHATTLKRVKTETSSIK